MNWIEYVIAEKYYFEVKLIFFPKISFLCVCEKIALFYSFLFLLLTISRKKL